MKIKLAKRSMVPHIHVVPTRGRLLAQLHGQTTLPKIMTDEKECIEFIVLHRLLHHSHSSFQGHDPLLLTPTSSDVHTGFTSRFVKCDDSFALGLISAYLSICCEL